MDQRTELRATSSVADQVSGEVIAQINAERLADEALKLGAQDSAFLKSLSEMARVRDFVNKPEHILGSGNTKHGEIAEQVEVAVRRAREVLASAEPTATFDDVGRLAPEDYRIADLDVQSKFINGSNQTLDHVLKHMKKYEGFGGDGSYYHIPKDQHAQIMDVLGGKTDGLSEKTIRAIREKVSQIEHDTGKNFQDAVKPSVSKYSEVQLGKVHDTLDQHEGDLEKQNKALKDNIQDEHQASISEGLKAAGTAAVVGAAVGFTTRAWKKYLEGKNIFKGDYSAEDWKDVGGAAFKGGVGGLFAGSAIYALTNCAEMSAPFAGAFVSAAKGVASLVADYHAGKITIEALIDNGLFVCSDAAIVGLCTAAGQTLIPIPVLGAVLGSMAGKFLSTFLAGQMRDVQIRLEAKRKEFLTTLGVEYQKLVADIESSFARLGDLTRAAFDISRNEALVECSVSLARAYGVADGAILRTESELDGFMGFK